MFGKFFCFVVMKFSTRLVHAIKEFTRFIFAISRHLHRVSFFFSFILITRILEEDFGTKFSDYKSTP